MIRSFPSNYVQAWCRTGLDTLQGHLDMLHIKQVHHLYLKPCWYWNSRILCWQTTWVEMFACGLTDGVLLGPEQQIFDSRQKQRSWISKEIMSLGSSCWLIENVSLPVFLYTCACYISALNHLVRWALSWHQVIVCHNFEETGIILSHSRVFSNAEDKVKCCFFSSAKIMTSAIAWTYR